ncbi:hypothetical protein FPOAC1_004011 [Fusarium poae]|uniref:hypothetical protein n=1 Tax=Fusarium poae TaxID=36050 RepID=UPI001CE909FE|nr:hypothetical protein FPOAC1_004011 [Fusarium poae]KAG8670777.1 hypothetical protein FPOAC1_004011 [Fusarium poae]
MHICHVKKLLATVDPKTPSETSRRVSRKYYGHFRFTLPIQEGAAFKIPTETNRCHLDRQKRQSVRYALPCVEFNAWPAANDANFSLESANQLSTSSWFASWATPSGYCSTKARLKRQTSPKPEN